MLRLLLALLREPQLSKTALSLGVSIGTASRDLKTAREILGDKLYVRSGGLMVPTRRMLELAPAFEHVIASLEALVRPGVPFSPAHSHETFEISAPDNTAATVLLPAMARLREEAPGMNFRVRMLEDTVFDELRSGDVDLAIFCDPSIHPGASFHQKTLLRSRHVLIMRKGHPLEALSHERALEAADIEPYSRIGIVSKRLPAAVSRDSGRKRGQGKVQRNDAAFSGGRHFSRRFGRFTHTAAGDSKFSRKDPACHALRGPVLSDLSMGSGDDLARAYP